MFLLKNIICLGVIFSLVLSFYCAGAQTNDTSANNSSEKHKNIFQLGINAITRGSVDSSMQANVLNIKNEAPFLPYQGKVIRHIIINQFSFEKAFTDTLKQTRPFAVKFINRLHRNTKEWVIRNNLFFKENTFLNAGLIADNERYLRSLEYIHDARIVVKKITGQSDSVDLVVMTKDFLSLTLALNSLQANRFKARIGDVNILGTAQKFQFTTLIEKKRNPGFGYELLYRINSIASTFINATVDYSIINSNLKDGSEDEHAWYIKLERPLVSQYLHFAGGLLFGDNKTVNSYAKPDSLFYKYHYNTVDGWLGYNLGVHKFLFSRKIKSRQFLSLRYFSNKFAEVPYQVKDQFNFRFNSRQAMLAQFTFFRQNFYKTNYVYGFGVTEDVPYGYNIAFTAGWYKQLQLKRLYAGIDANRYIITDKGKVLQYFLRTGSFINRGELQDAAILAGVSKFSRIFSFKNIKIRQYLRFSYTQQFNRIGLDPLFIYNDFGLRYFNTDSASGDQRISLHTETFFFLKYKLLGYKFAPFAFGDIVLLKPEHENFAKSALYYGLGGGLRIRNENIVFGTVEVRFIYFPRKSQQSNVFKILINTNIRFRYNSNYVKPPDIIQLNSDPDNNID